MTDPEKIHFKNKLKRLALDLIGQRITAASKSIDQVQQAANQEEKSSAGDKYETSRAMGHLQKDMLARQLGEYVKEMSALHAVPVDAIYLSAQIGAFIDCGETSFFIAAGLGKQVIEGQTIFFLSPQAPLARGLQQKKAGEEFLFSGKNTRILEIF
jgi:hypothetical protein